MDDFDDYDDYSIYCDEPEKEEDEEQSDCKCGSQCMNCLGMTWGDFL